MIIFYIFKSFSKVRQIRLFCLQGTLLFTNYCICVKSWSDINVDHQNIDLMTHHNIGIMLQTTWPNNLSIKKWLEWVETTSYFGGISENLNEYHSWITNANTTSWSKLPIEFYILYFEYCLNHLCIWSCRSCCNIYWRIWQFWSNEATDSLWKWWNASGKEKMHTSLNLFGLRPVENELWLFFEEMKCF